MKHLFEFSCNVMLFLMGFHASVSALEAPYLISAIPQSDSRIILSWRNNDISASGFLVERKDSSEVDYHFIDSIKSASTLSYTDTKNLNPQTIYSYRLKAYSETAVSDTSNHLEVITLALTLRKAKIALGWSVDTPQGVRVIIYDSSNCEIGYHIYRGDGNEATLTKIATISSGNPLIRDSIIWYDSAAQSYKWYSYRVAAYTELDSLFSDPCFTYTFCDYHPTEVWKFTKISEFPLSVSGWSAKAGDSIILKESNSPDGKFSVVNVKDPASPKFAGYIDSIALLSYPANTLIPVFLTFGVVNSFHMGWRAAVNSDRLLLVSGNNLIRYSIGTDFSPIDTLSLNARPWYYSIFFLNDSILTLSSAEGSLPSSENYSFVKITTQKLSLWPEHFAGSSSYGGGFYISTQINPQGITDGNTIIITSDYGLSGNGILPIQTHSIFAYDIHSNRLIKHTTSAPFSKTSNTGLYISSTENINLHASSTVTELFISDIRDSRGYQTCLRNNAVYTDTSLPQNSLQNIFLDTLSKKVFVISNTKLTVLGYSSMEIGVISRTKRNSSPGRFLVTSLLNGSGIKFVFPDAASMRVEVCIFDLSGHLVDKIVTVGSNTMFWKPKVHSANCLVAMASIGNERFVSRFIMKY